MSMDDYTEFRILQLADLLERIIPPMLKEATDNADYCLKRFPPEREKALFFIALSNTLRQLEQQIKDKLASL